MKRILSLLICIITTISLFAQSFSGRTYKSSTNMGAATLTITLNFTSDSQGSITMSSNLMASEKYKFSYKVNGDKIDIVFAEDNSKSSIEILPSDKLAMNIEKYRVTFKRADTGGAKSKSHSRSKSRK